MIRVLIAAVVLVTLSACGRTAPQDSDTGPDTEAPAPPVGEAPANGAQDSWPDAGPVDYRRERAVDLTGDGRNEIVSATARGPAYDALDVAITIEGADGDTLWYETWPSLLYFKYDAREGKADTTVMRIVRDHVEELLEENRFTMGGGLPMMLRRGGDPDALMSEAIHYHLAELDYRRRAGLRPGTETPPEGHSRISTDNVPTDRVSAVLAEVKTKPSFMYYAGGEASYTIAWSDRENAFVRIFSCC